MENFIFCAVNSPKKCTPLKAKHSEQALTLWHIFINGSMAFK